MTAAKMQKLKRLTRALALAVGVACASPVFAFADCTTPAGVAGDIAYGTNNVMAYCNGSSWVAMGSGASFGTLTTGSFCTATSGTSISCTTSGINLASQVTGILPLANGGTGTSTAFTAGSVVFAGTSGVYTQDNTNFFWDSTNHRLGIGTTTPAASLDLSNVTGAVALPMGTTGTRPTGVNGMIRYNSSLPGLEAYINGSWQSLMASGASGTSIGTGTANYVARWLGTTTIGTGILYDDGTKVGVGTATPTAGLTVNTTTAFPYGTDLTTAGSQSAVTIGTNTSVRYSGTAAATWYGIAAGVSGQIVYLTNASSYALTLSNQSASETTAANRIITGTSADLPVAAGSAVVLQYDGTAVRWRVMGGGGSGSGSGGASFLVNRNGVSQTVSTATWTKVQFNNEVYDTNSNFDSTTNYRFQPTVAGKYIFVFNLYCANACYAQIQKNGTRVQQNNAPSGPFTTSIIVDMNGSTDYVEAWGYNASGTSIDGTSEVTNFSGALVGSASGGGSASLSGGTANYLTKWTSATAVGTSAVYDDGTNVGIGTTSPTAKMTVAGTTAFPYGTDLTTTGAQSAVAIGSSTSVRYSGSATATWYGIAAGVSGQIVYLTNASSSTLTLSNQSTSETTAANRIITGTSADLAVAAGSAVVLQYDGTAARWRVMGGAGGSASGGTTPSFLANKNGTAQTVTASTITKLTFSKVVFDTNNNFSTSTGRFTPTVAGKYLIVGNVYCSQSNSSYCQAYIYKNGTVYQRTAYVLPGDAIVNASAIVDMNGSTDYVELYGLTQTGTSISGDISGTSFSGTLISSGSGGGASLSGGTANYNARWLGASSIGTGSIYDTGTLVSVGTSTTGSLFGVYGGMTIGTGYIASSAPGNGLLVQGNVGVGTTSPTSKLTVNGSTAFTYGTNYSTTGSQADVNLGTNSSVRYTGSAAATFYGIVAGNDGQVLFLSNGSNYTLTLANKSTSEATALNQIVTGTGADLTVAANSSVILQYDTTATNAAGPTGAWRVIGGSGASSGGSSGTTWVQIASTDISTAATSYTFSGLNGDTDEQYRVVARVVSTYAGNACYVVSPNADTATANYTNRQIYGNGTAVGANAVTAGGLYFANTNAAGQTGLGELLLDAKSGRARLARGMWGSATYQLVTTIADLWSNTSSPITSLQVSTYVCDSSTAITTGLGAGTHLELWAKRSVGGSSGGTPAGSSGQVQFNNAGAFGADGAFTWDNTNKYLGIGTATPAYMLDATAGTVAGKVMQIVPQSVTMTPVASNNAITMNPATSGQLAYYSGTNAISGTANIYVSGSNIGIGTNVATNNLSFAGSAPQTIWMERHPTANTAGNNLTLQAGGAASGGSNLNGGNLVLASGIATGTGSSQIQFKVYPAGASGLIDASATTAMTITGAGNVGIGTASPSATLDVNGTVRPQAATLGAACTPLGAQAYNTSTGAPLYCSTGAVWTAVATVVSTGWDFVVEDQKASGTAAGTPTVGANTRTLNTVVQNTIGATLAANIFTLPAGTYEIEWDAPAWYCWHKADLYSSTGTFVGGGTSSYSNTAGYSDTIRSEGRVQVTLSSAGSFYVRHYISSAAGATVGLGQPASSGNPEIYTRVRVRKLQ